MEAHFERAQAAGCALLLAVSALHGRSTSSLAHRRTGLRDSLIVSNHRAVENLAAYYRVPFEHVPVTAETRAAAEARQVALLEQNEIELVILARYMQILSPAFVARYPAG